MEGGLGSIICIYVPTGRTARPLGRSGLPFDDGCVLWMELADDRNLSLVRAAELNRPSVLHLVITSIYFLFIHEDSHLYNGSFIHSSYRQARPFFQSIRRSHFATCEKQNC